MKFCFYCNLFAQCERKYTKSSVLGLKKRKTCTCKVIKMYATCKSFEKCLLYCFICSIHGIILHIIFYINGCVKICCDNLNTLNILLTHINTFLYLVKTILVTIKLLHNAYVCLCYCRM